MRVDGAGLYQPGVQVHFNTNQFELPRPKRSRFTKLRVSSESIQDTEFDSSELNQSEVLEMIQLAV